MECWGAQGGDQSRTNGASGTGTGPNPYGGKGAYVCGQIILNKTDLYVYVGEEGGYNNNLRTNTFNGGGGGGIIPGSTIDGRGARGGGATDIRTVNGDWNNSASLNSRIIIAAGGGGCTTYGTHAGRTGDGSGGAAGGLIGYDGLTTNVSGQSTSSITNAKGGTQSGGGDGWKSAGVISGSQSGGLGIGGTPTATNGGEVREGGGGSGKYGGGSGGVVSARVGSGAGGSSYISGHPGCSTITGYAFISGTTKMIDGKGLTWTTSSQTAGGTAERMPTTSGGQEALNTGHSGDGYAKITMVTPLDN